MLVKLELDQRKVFEYNKTTSKLHKENPFDGFDEMMVNYNKPSEIIEEIEIGFYNTNPLIINEVKCFNKTSEYDSFSYNFDQSLSTTENLKGYMKYSETNENRKNYGMSDNIDQIKEHYPELEESDVKYYVDIHVLVREKQHPTGGFRFHKNGEYIGDVDICHEYFYDQTDLDEVLLYHINEILD